MSRESVEELIDKWMSDKEFRADIRKDAEGAVRRLGMDLTEEEWAALRNVDWSLSDEELKSRISRAA